MNAFWMSNPVPEGKILDSREFGSFRERLLQRPLGEIGSKEVAFGDGAGIALFETTLELVRFTEFPGRPSRWQSLFLWPNLELAREYHNEAPYASLYEISVEEARSEFRGDFDLITYYPNPLTLEGFIQKARLYWKGEVQSGRVEILLDGKIQVQKKLL